MGISVLRLGHRIFRDQRISSHCALVARALGATELVYTGEKDSSLEDSVRKVVKNWGGSFKITYIKDHKELLREFRGKIVHLTVYGTPFQKKIKEVKKQGNLLVIVGGEKVPPEVYQKADYNLSVGSQPHSEVAALGIFLHELQGRKFKNFSGKLRIIPQERGKKLLTRKRKELDTLIPHEPFH